MTKNNRVKKILFLTTPLLPVIGVSAWAAYTFTSGKSSDSSKQTQKLSEDNKKINNSDEKEEKPIEADDVEKETNNDSSDDNIDSENSVTILRVKKPLPKLHDIESFGSSKPNKKQSKDTKYNNSTTSNSSSTPKQNNSPKDKDETREEKIETHPSTSNTTNNKTEEKPVANKPSITNDKVDKDKPKDTNTSNIEKPIKPKEKDDKVENKPISTRPSTTNNKVENKPTKPRPKPPYNKAENPNTHTHTGSKPESSVGKETNYPKPNTNGNAANDLKRKEEEKEKTIKEIDSKINEWTQSPLISYFGLNSSEFNNTFKKDLENIVSNIRKELNLENKSLEELKDQNKIKGTIEKLVKNNVEAKRQDITINKNNHKDYTKVVERGHREGWNKDDWQHQPNIVFEDKLTLNNYWYVIKQKGTDVSLTFDFSNNKFQNSLLLKNIEIVVDDKRKTQFVDKHYFFSYFHIDVFKKDGSRETVYKREHQVLKNGRLGVFGINYNKFNFNINDDVKKIDIVFWSDLKFPSIHQVKIHASHISNLVWKNK